MRGDSSPGWKTQAGPKPLRGGFGLLRSGLLKRSRTALGRPPAQLHGLLAAWQAEGAPTQGEVDWGQDHWVGRFKDHDDFLRRLPPRLSREDVFERAAMADQSAIAAVRAALVVMAWGWRGLGRGRSFAERLSGAPDSGAHLRIIAAALRTDGPDAGYEELTIRRSSLPGIGPAYATKFLFFAQLDSAERRALILDEDLQRWLSRVANKTFNAARWDPDQYRCYLDLIHGWAGQLATPPESIELAIFRDQNRRKGGYWGAK